MLIGGSRRRVMRYLDVKNSKEEEDHWIGSRPTAATPKHSSVTPARDCSE
jgi:hypothetical protein